MPKESRQLTPRPYLSWSQLHLFETSPKSFIRRYVYGESVTSAAMEFGSRIASGLENDETDDLQVEHLRLFLPNHTEREKEMRGQWGAVPLLARFDMWNTEGCIGELKTGTVPWTQKRADEWGQLTFYALIAWLNYGRIPRLELYWAPTETDADREVRLTGELRTFVTKRTMSDVVKMGARINKAWRSIQKVYTEEINTITS